MEFRLHGIGEHGAASGLGSSPRAHIAAKRGTPTGDKQTIGVSAVVDEWDVPRLPDHRLVLLGWSRFSRRLARFLWFVAMPFSLVNVAAEMRAAVDEGADAPPKAVRHVDGQVWILSRYLWGPLISVGALIWIIAWTESLMRSVDLGVFVGLHPWNPWLGPKLGVLLGFGLAAAFWLRQFKVEARVATSLLTAHSLAVLAAGAALWRFRPTSIRVSQPLMGWANNPEGLLDPIRAYCVLVGVAVLLWWLYLALRQGNHAYRALGGSAWWGAGFAVASAFILLNVGGSMLRLGLDWAGRYLRSLFGREPTAELLPPGLRTVLPANAQGTDEWVDLIPLALLPFLLIIMLVIVAKAWDADAGLTDARARKQLIHNAVDRLPANLTTGTVLISTLAWGLLVFAGWHAEQLSQREHGWAVMMVHFLGAVLTLWFLSAGKLGGSKFGPTLSRVADVVGFWPIRSHPFAGLSYRDPVVDVLRSRIVAWQDAKDDDEPLIFAGHSQGSVLAAWLMRPTEAAAAGIPMDSVHLVTCGSPLRSLYATFFTAHFSDRFFADVQGFSAGWINFWRDTDPIATPVPEAQDEEIADPHLLGHGDYWTEEQQMNAIAVWHGEKVHTQDNEEPVEEQA